MRGSKTGVITSRDRCELFREVLPRGTIIESDPGRRLSDVMREFSRKAVDVALIDDAGLADPAADELAILDWSALPQKRPVRILFMAAPERKAKDPFLRKLEGLPNLDVVMPEGGAFPMSAALERIEGYGANGPDARVEAGEEAASHPFPDAPSCTRIDVAEEGEEREEPSWSAMPPDEPEKKCTRTRHCKTVSVASLFGHPGATTLAMSIAFWLARDTRKRIVCALSDNSFLHHLKAGFKESADGDSFSYKGVVFCSFSDAEALASDAAWAVFDCGRLFTTHVDTPASAAHRRFYTSDMKLMCIQGQPWDMPKLKDALGGMAPGEVSSWTWCARSAAGELIAQARAYLSGVGADTDQWFKVPENPEFFARKGKDGLPAINYNGLFSKSADARRQEGDAHEAERSRR